MRCQIQVLVVRLLHPLLRQKAGELRIRPAGQSLSQIQSVSSRPCPPPCTACRAVWQTLLGILLQLCWSCTPRAHVHRRLSPICRDLLACSCKVKAAFFTERFCHQASVSEATQLQVGMLSKSVTFMLFRVVRLHTDVKLN